MSDGVLVNVEQAAVWDGAVGDHRVRFAELADAWFEPHNARFRTAIAAGSDDHVLDIGCGTGQSTRQAARVAARAHGIDLSARMLEHARLVTAREGLDNVTFEQADAQAHPLPTKQFDVGISRFGSMFFADPVAAFANIGRALRPTGRLVLIVWRARELNEWSAAIRESLMIGRDIPPPPTEGPNPYSLADPDVARSVLEAAGFTGIEFTDVHEPIRCGANTAEAFDFVRGLQGTNDMLVGLDEARTERALDSLRAMLAEHETSEGVVFDSRAWIITADREE